MMPEPPLQPSLPQAGSVPFDVVALVTAAGGLEALSAVLRDLPSPFPAAVIVAQRLSGNGRTSAHILGRRTTLPVTWMQDGVTLAPGQVWVCPPGQRLELLPDGTCSLSPHEGGARNRSHDFFLESLADSFGKRAMVIVLTGLGTDGAAGARAVKQAGGVVIVQSEDTAEHPVMPRAAIERGAADLVLPLYEIGAVIARVVGGGRLPRPRTEIEAAEALFAGGGDLGALMREKDWSATPLGPVSKWPQALKTAVRIALTSRHSAGVWWGEELIYLYNDAHRATLGDKHPQALGSPAAQVWREVWYKLGPRAATTLAGTTGTFDEAFFLLMERSGYTEETYYTFSYSPVPNDYGGPGGLFFANTEDTQRIIGERQLTLLRELEAHTANASTVADVGTLSTRSLQTDPRDFPFALLYLLDKDQQHIVLAGTAGMERGHRAAPEVVALQDATVWPLAEVLRTNSLCHISQLRPALGALPTGAWERPPTQAVALPITPPGWTGRAGVLIAGLNPHRLFDESYRGFLSLVAGQIAAALATANAYEEERKRAEALAEIDRAKALFFSNVSHEFRTPLTLMLAPLEELLRRRDELPRALAEEIDVAARNTRRLLTLVNTLLDFSRIEAGRLRTQFAPTDLATLTADIANLFRSATERAGLRLHVNCPPLPESIWVDRGMWEQVVSNLLSNALKFTFAGEISVELHALPQHVELTVRDTGVGIPKAELPHLFKRFHRVQGTRARSHEGVGVGLALAHELVRLHQGRMRAQSKEGEGTTFTVWIPRAPRPYAEAVPEQSRTHRLTVAATLAEEATRWYTQDEAAAPPPAEVVHDPLGRPTDPPLQTRVRGARVLVVDDNADMRTFLHRLLSPHWQIDTAKDGAEALTQAGGVRPDLVLADVMMPNVDGFELLRRLRQNGGLTHTPVILVTARAGEESAIEGLLAGADDYIVKPFSARELLARVGAQLELSRMRRRDAEINAFRVKLSDTLRALADPVEIQAEAARVLGEHLQADRTLYAEVDADGETYVVRDNYVRGDYPYLLGRFASSDFGEASEFLREGRTLVVEDMNADEKLSIPARAAFLAAGVGAIIALSLVKSGRWVSVFGVHSAAPRRWKQEEIAVVEETAERTWAAVERARTEVELRQLYGELEQRVEDRTRALQEAEVSQHALTRQLLTMQEAERRHLARELHDEVMQTLTALQINLDLLAQGQPDPPETLRASTALVDDLVDQVRTLALDLRPTVLDELGLTAALEWYCQRQVPRLGLKAYYVSDPNLSRPHPAIETTCFRVAQEAVTNVARHAQTDAVWIDLHEGNDALHLTIRDQGVGFDADATRPRAGQDVGVGLHGMEERLRLVGGRLEIRSAPGRGTVVQVWTPLRPSANGHGFTAREEI